MEELSQSSLESQGKFPVQEIQEGVYKRSRDCNKPKSDDLSQMVSTRWIKVLRFLSMMAWTILPLTVAR